MGQLLLMVLALTCVMLGVGLRISVPDISMDPRCEDHHLNGLQAFKERGVMLIRGAIPRSEVKLMMTEVKTLPWSARATNYPVKDFNWTQAQYAQTNQIVSQTMAHIALETDSKTDDTYPLGLVFEWSPPQNGEWVHGTNGLADMDFSDGLGWHQDVESFMFCEDHINHLNFYVMLENSDPTHSNLQFVPLDNLRRHAKAVHQRSEGSGSAKFISKGIRAPGYIPCCNSSSKTDEPCFHDEEFCSTVSGSHFARTDIMHTGDILPFNPNLNDISCAPHLMPGDMLVHRMDVIHKTQDRKSSQRTALSIHAIKGDCELKRHCELPRTEMLEKFIDNPLWLKVEALFRSTGEKHITLKRFLSGQDGTPAFHSTVAALEAAGHTCAKIN